MRMTIQPAYRDYSAFISRIPDIFDTEGEMIYQGRNTIKRFMYEGREWIVKRYKKPNLIQRISYTFFKKSKAERAYLFSFELQARGIDTPEGIAYIENRRNGLVDDCFFISATCNDRTVNSTFGGKEEFDTHLADCLAAFFVQMHTKGVLHGDLNLSNILYHKKDEEDAFAFSVIDTNRSVFKSSPTRQECLDNLKRVTHQRALLRYIVTQYAILREWNPEESVHTVMKALEKFERKRKMKRALKKTGVLKSKV